MTEYNWQFNKMERRDTNVDPIASEFFTTEALKSLSDALLRETVQNALDAGIGKPVRVRFDLTGISNPADGSRCQPFFRGLDPHLKSQGAGLIDKPDLEDVLSYMVIEDFNTRGLTGDPEQYKDEELAEGEKNNFYYFWRNVGRSKKSEKDRGRWGLGKTVFPASSLINTFFGLTIRNDDEQCLLMGQSVLKIHSIGGSRYQPYGFFARFDGEDQFQLPIREAGAIRDFKRVFGLMRNSEPGLSVVVPFPREEISASGLISSALGHFFFPILSGDLVIEVVDSESSNIVSRDSIRQIAASQSNTGLISQNHRDLFSFCEWAISAKSEDFLTLEAPSASPSWTEATLRQDEISAVKTKLEAGEPIGVRVPICIHRGSSPGEQSYFDVFFKREAQLQEGEVFFIREGLTIPEPSQHRARFIRGLVIIEDDPISNLLGDAENPAHTDWRPRSTKVSHRYRYAEATVRFVKQSLVSLVRLVTGPPEGIDEHLLRDVFFLDVPEEDNPPDEPGGGEGQADAVLPPQPPRPVIEGAPLFPVVVERAAGGFILKSRSGAAVMGRTFALQVAYHTRRGNPFRRYDVFDFELDKTPIKIVASGATLNEVRENLIVFTADQENLSIQVTGFDSRRDLRIDLTHSEEAQ